jgi:hypothetical protein
MKTILAILLTCATMRADFSYQSTTQLTGGSIYNMMKALGPLARGARDPIVTTNLIKGNRMATIAKDRATIIDLDKETITEIDTAKKQYSVITFAQMKQAMDDAIAKAQQQKGAPAKGNTEAKFKVSAKATGQTKAVGVLNAKEMLLTMTMEATDKDSGKSGSMDITVDSWLAAVPGYEEVKAFHRKMGEKLGYAFGSGMSQIAMTQPQSLTGFAEVAKEMNKVEGVPVESTTKMGSAGSPDSGSSDASAAPAPQQQSRSPLDRLPGFGRKKNDQSKDQPAADQSSASLVETTTQLGSFSSGPVDAAKFEVPAGFKKVDAKR